MDAIYGYKISRVQIRSVTQDIWMLDAKFDVDCPPLLCQTVRNRASALPARHCAPAETKLSDAIQSAPCFRK
jgi:hypothetical protein